MFKPLRSKPLPNWKWTDTAIDTTAFEVEDDLHMECGRWEFLGKISQDDYGMWFRTPTTKMRLESF